MSDREPEIVDVATVRLGPSRRPGSAGARRPVSVVLVLIVAIAIPALAFVGPRVEWRPEIDLALLRPSDVASPSPTRTPRPTPAPVASPPPALTVGDGERPGRIPIDVGGLRFVDASTGRLTAPVSTIHLDTDAAFAAPGGGWWCVCFRREQVGQEETVDIEIRHLDRSAVETARFPIRTIHSSATPPSQDLYTRFDVEVGPDGRTAYLVSAARSGGRWTVALESLDLASGSSLDRVELGTLDVPTISPEEASQGYEPWFGGPTLRLSPDGRRLVAGAWVERPSPTGEPVPPDPVVWLIEVGGGAGSIDRVAATTGALRDVYATCAYALQWLTNDSLLGACWQPGGNTAGPPVALMTYGLDGSVSATVGYTPDQTWWTSEPILDRANRVVYYWSPMGHLLDAIDLVTGHVDRVSVDPDVASASPPTRTGPRTDPEWVTFSSDYVPWSNPQLLAEPGGGRIFGIGLVEGPESQTRGGNFGSSGIWVFDAATLRLLDRWPAAAAYGAIRLTRDGRWMLAIGQQDADSAGNHTTWPISITVHDARDGRMALQAGNLGRDVGAFLPP
jgi:hypothetical protein